MITADIPGGQTIVYVDDNGPFDPAPNDPMASDPDEDGTPEHPYDEIQEAVDAVAENGEIIVNEGTYTENIYIDQSLILKKNESATRPIIQGLDTSKSTIEVMADAVELSGFEISNAAGLENRYHGVSLGKTHLGELQSLSDCIISDCYITDAHWGIFIKGSSNTVSSCTIYDCAERGISLVTGSTNVLTNNILTDNEEGIRLGQSITLTEITDNTITSSSGSYGIYVESSSSSNMIYHNHLDNVENAMDQGSDNQWDDGSEGNWWSDYEGFDENEDGIGDTPYVNNGVTDTYPTGRFQSAANQPPVATITSVQPTTVNYGEAVYCSGTGFDPDDDPITSYNWRSSVQGQLSTQQSFSTSTLSPGSHVLYFKVFDGEDWSPEKTRSVTVQPPSNQAPVAHIESIAPQHITIGQTVYFQGYGTDDDGTIISYRWESSLDEVLSTQSYFNSSWLSVGTHTIEFSVMDNEGSWSEPAHGTVVVEATSTAANMPPVSIPGGPYIIEINTTAQFDGRQSYDPDGSLVIYSWDFGDGTTGRGPALDHVYSSLGNKTLTLRVTDNNGSSNTATTVVTVVAQGSIPTDEPETPGEEPWLLPSNLLIPLAVGIVIIGVLAGVIFWIKRP